VYERSVVAREEDDDASDLSRLCVATRQRGVDEESWWGSTMEFTTVFGPPVSRTRHDRQ
jgi:hypothetical protein